jgi:hypothetical protein
MGALARISEHDIPANAAAAAGDQRHLVLQSHRNSPLSCLNKTGKITLKRWGEPDKRTAGLENGAYECHLWAEQQNR